MKMIQAIADLRIESLWNGVVPGTYSVPTEPIFVRCLRQPSGKPIVTVTGFYGWISRIWKAGKTDKGVVPSDSLDVQLLREQSFRAQDCWQTTLLQGDFEIVPSTPELIKAYQDFKAKEQPPSPEVQKMLDSIHKNYDKYAKMEKRLNDAKAKRLNPFIPKSAITRNDKTGYPTYDDFERQGFGNKQRLLACKEKLTLTDRVNLAFLREASDRCSFWSGQERVRHLVQELDLDPYVDKFNQALYDVEKYVAVEASQLRVFVITALNEGKVILDIDDAIAKYTPTEIVNCSRDETPTHFFVTVGKRKQLPAVA